MNRPFDIRKQVERSALADLLPKIDQAQFNITREEFLDALEAVSSFLKNPDWLVYQWGSFRPFDAGPAKLILSLKDVITLGLQLRCLCKFINFDMLLGGFFNPPQFEDTLFEVRVAYLFALLPATNDLCFSPEYKIRGHLKRPEFEVETEYGCVCVECKRPHLFVQKALQSLHKVADHFKAAMSKHNWPADLRLEVEIKGPLSGNILEFIDRILEQSSKVGPRFDPIIVGPFYSYAERRYDSFRLPSGPWHTDTMILDKNVATGLLNPEFTALRVANYSLDSKFEKSVGIRINEALRQLPETEKCMIFIGGVSPRIAEPVCRKRFNDKVYDHIRAFGICRNALQTLVFRKSDFGFIGGLFESIESITIDAQPASAPDAKSLGI